VLLLGEGVATVLSAREATGHLAIAALAAGNLLKVAEAIQARYPKGKLIVLGDAGKAVKYAEEAARAVGAALAVPSFTPEQATAFQEQHGKPPTDFNDLAALAGLHAVKQQIEGAHQAESATESTPTQSKTEPEPHPRLYEANEFGIFRHIHSGKEARRQQLCNFTALIVEEIARDNGLEITRALIIEDEQNGRKLSPAALSADEFSGMNWPVKHWGTSCQIWPGMGVKDSLRHAIMVLSYQDREPKRRTVYTHTGWRNTPQGRVYLSAGAVIGAQGEVPGIEVDIGTLSRYALPAPSTTAEERLTAAQASYLALKVAPERISVPLIAAAFLAPLTESLRVDFGIWLEGPSRSQKSTYAGLIAAHFGPEIERTTLPASFVDTGNALEAKAFTLADSLLVVDDYAPQPSRAAQARVDDAVHRIVRGIGNRTGRGRLNTDSNMRPQREPRGLCLMTGEQWPTGESIMARLFGVSIRPGDVDLGRLTESQRNAKAGLLARSMADYIRVIAEDFDGFLKNIQGTIETYRNLALSEGLKGRTPDQVGFLMGGYLAALAHWRGSGAITDSEFEEMMTLGWCVLLQLALEHERRLVQNLPAVSFCEALADLLLAGRVHLTDKLDSRQPNNASLYGWRDGNPQGTHVGWVNENEGLAYLLPVVAYDEVSKALRQSDQALNLRPQALWRQLRDHGYLLEGNIEDRDGDTVARSTRRVKINGKAIWVLCFRLNRLFAGNL
jgi:hypothetical protein